MKGTTGFLDPQNIELGTNIIILCVLIVQNEKKKLQNDHQVANIKNPYTANL